MVKIEDGNLHPVKDGFIGELTGLDLNDNLNQKCGKILRQAHDIYPVIVIRNQSLCTQSFMNFCKIFGAFEIDHHLPQFQDKNHPEIVYLTNRDLEGNPDPASAERGAVWHCDSTYKEHPCAHTVLYAMEIPTKGAGTYFSDSVRSYETLPDKLKDAIFHRQAKHKFGAGPALGGVIPMTEEQEDMHPPVTHPMVRIHPTTGRTGLYINPLHVYGIVGMKQEKASILLKKVFEHALRPEFQHLHNYRVGDLVIWDQRRTMHKAEAAYSMKESRLLMRAKLNSAR